MNAADFPVISMASIGAAPFEDDRIVTFFWESSLEKWMAYHDGHLWGCDDEVVNTFLVKPEDIDQEMLSRVRSGARYYYRVEDGTLVGSDIPNLGASSHLSHFGGKPAN